MLREASACPLRARSAGQRRVLTVTSGQPDTPDHRNPHRGHLELPASGGAIDLEGTAFLTLSGGKVTEVRTVFDSLALAVQTGAAEAPAWWPGRS